jgi:aspartyl-tRNA(Asn)/glutamyl-tRNA(Gln) amidotransferase subunit C
MALERNEVERVAMLARIGLTDEEMETLGEQLSNILEQFRVLSELDTAGVTPTAHPVQLQTVMRDDVPDSSLESEEVLSNAPRQESDFFRVKPVLEE